MIIMDNASERPAAMSSGLEFATICNRLVMNNIVERRDLGFTLRFFLQIE